MSRGIRPCLCETVRGPEDIDMSCPSFRFPVLLGPPRRQPGLVDTPGLTCRRPTRRVQGGHAGPGEVVDTGADTTSGDTETRGPRPR